jgi:hypothetical protein
MMTLLIKGDNSLQGIWSQLETSRDELLVEATSEEPFIAPLWKYFDKVVEVEERLKKIAFLEANNQDPQELDEAMALQATKNSKGSRCNSEAKKSSIITKPQIDENEPEIIPQKYSLWSTKEELKMDALKKQVNHYEDKSVTN